MDEGRRVQSLAGLFKHEFLRRQFAQFRIDQRQELRRGTRTAPVDGRQDAGNVVHRPQAVQRQCKKSAKGR
jgi:hypothetical protein